MSKYIILLVLGLLLGATAGWYLLPKETVTVEIEKQVEVVRTEVQWKDRIVTVTRTVKPDGTVQETTKTEEREGSKVKDSSKEQIASTPILPNYSLGAGYQVRYSDLLGDVTRPSPTQIEVRLGRRLLGPVWGEVGASMKQVTMGVRYEF